MLDALGLGCGLFLVSFIFTLALIIRQVTFILITEAVYFHYKEFKYLPIAFPSLMLLTFKSSSE